MPFRPNATGNSDRNGGSRNASAAMARARVTSGDTDGDTSGTDPRSFSCSALSRSDHAAAAHLVPSTSNSSLFSSASTQRAAPPSAYTGQNDLQGLTSRRRQSSIPKVPMGPRPPDFANGKRQVRPATCKVAAISTDSFLEPLAIPSCSPVLSEARQLLLPKIPTPAN